MYFLLEDRARELAETIGADAISLADLENYHPEDGMILANTTAIGMQPKVDETPIPKVVVQIPSVFSLFHIFISNYRIVLKLTCQILG